jgi:hypothetical protein
MKHAISKIRRPSVSIKNFASLWTSPASLWTSPPIYPRPGDRIFALIMCDDLPRETDSPEEKEMMAPYVAHLVVAADDICGQPCNSYFHINSDGSYCRDEDEDDDGNQSQDKVILTQNYNIVLWIKEEDYWANVEATKAYGPWIFVEEVDGDYAAAMEAAQKLAENDPQYEYRIWDPRS